MRKYEEMKQKLVELGFKTWQLFTTEKLEELEEKDPTELEITGAITSFTRYLNNELGYEYEYEEIDGNLAPCYGNSMGMIERIPVDEELGFEELKIIGSQIYARVMDEENEAELYVMISN